MCGIAGIIEYRDGPSALGDLERMIAVQHHRGPDSAAYFQHENVLLGHNRLRIIDLSAAADQPMSNEDGTLWLVFNGEIYNYRELRSALVKRGHDFKSNSDSEILLHLFEDKGPRLVEELNGIFAFAILDIKSRSLFAARDHLGVKPLYFTHDGHRFMFASETKALLAGGASNEVDADALQETLVFTHVSGARTLFRSVQRLLPGETLSVGMDHGNVTRRRYWVPSLSAEPIATEEAVEQIHELLVQSVRRQLIADVPVGTMCSGGIDSSLISALASREMRHPLDTYVVEVQNERFNEAKFADAVSRHIGSKHHVLTTNPEDFDAMLPLAIWLHDEPLYHENSIPILQISLLAKHQVTVLLSGEGADELHGGYANQRQLRTIKRLRHLLPPPLARLLEPYAWNIRWSKPARALQRIAAPHIADAMVVGASRISPAALSQWGLRVGDAWAYRRSVAADAVRATSDPMLAHILYDQQVYLPTLLDRQDKMSMGASIESRVPFLDVPLVEATNGLGMSLRHRNGLEKWVLRQIGRRYLPETIVRRRKHAFGLPLFEWLRSSPILVRTIQRLTGGNLVRAGAIPTVTMNRIVGSWNAGNNTLAGLMWTAVNLELWWDIFVEGRAPSTDLLSSHATRTVASHPKQVNVADVSVSPSHEARRTPL